ncbi:MAG: hypothetical protein ACD_37C00659G0004 [uncultured bacterium]|nr:MAG: hypothetical protein ACD_37C00659G0004 [uncultured bacterium]
MSSSKNVEEKILDILYDKGAITFSFDLPYVYVNGLKSPIYIDNRLLISHPQERKYIISELVNLIKSKSWFKEIDYISSSLSHAAPFGILVAEELGLPLVLIRDGHKVHGKQNKMEGVIPKNKKVLIVEEHISTAASLLNNVDALRANGDIVKYAIAITDTKLDIAKKSLKEKGIEASVLVDGKSILDEAIKRGIIKGNERKEVEEWFENPVKWGTNRGYYYNSN